MTTINIRVDETVKQQATALFEDLGLDMSTALNLFLRQAIQYGGIPFEIRKPRWVIASDEELIAKLHEAEEHKEGGATGVDAFEFMAEQRKKYEKLSR